MSENNSGKNFNQDDLGAILNDAAHVFKESVAPALAQAPSSAVWPPGTTALWAGSWSTA